MYREHGQPASPELPDHLSELLLFLSHAPLDTDALQELLGYILLPALQRMLTSFEGEAGASNPYQCLLRAVLKQLEAIAETVSKEVYA
jgi:nitrate reductase assembly molybdenum cofactor insertion protein NarJ